MKLLDILRKLGLIRENGIFYIGGSDVLPPPLKGPEELLSFRRWSRGTRTRGSGWWSTISDWWCTSPGGLRTPASIWKI